MFSAANGLAIPSPEHELAQIEIPSPKRILHLIVASVIGGAISVGIFVSFERSWPQLLVRDKMSYPELISVILTGVAVSITVLGVFIAILAIWGFGNFEDIAKKTAKSYVKDQIKSGRLKLVIEEAAREYLEREFGENGGLRAILQSRIDAYLLSDADRRSGGSSLTGSVIELSNNADEEDE